MENLQRVKKTMNLQPIKNPLWRTIKVYKDLPSSRSSILHGLLEKHFFTSPRCLHLQEHAWSPSQSWSRPSPWSSIKKKMGFHSNPKWLRDECSKNSTHLFILENPKKKMLEDLNEFSWKANNILKGKGMRNTRTDYYSLLSP